MPSAQMPPWQRHTSAIVSGFVGDWLESRQNPLAVAMQVLEDGRPLDVSAPQPTTPCATLCLSVHGLMELETVWKIPGTGGDTYGSSLSGRIPGGVSSLTLRYNTGRPIYRNGEELADRLEQLVAGWPVPVTRLILMGHSMGGLLVRSACHVGRARGQAWVDALTDCVYVGSPHDGSWLARGAHAVAELMSDMPRDYLRVIGEVVDLRSEGIRNLSRGEVVAEGEDSPPLLPGVKHFVVCGLLARVRHNPLNALFGDALVHESSAQGEQRSGWHLAGMATFPGVDHVSLARHPDVAKQLEEWLV
jgi:pimeloyl-ACP methyl ester carboxylesterase